MGWRERDQKWVIIQKADHYLILTLRLQNRDRDLHINNPVLKHQHHGRDLQQNAHTLVQNQSQKEKSGRQHQKGT